MRHILFEIPTPWFTIPVMGYGLMIVLGFISGIVLATWRARRCGEHPDHLMNLGLLALIGGIVGARLLYVLQNPEGFTGQGLWGNLMQVIDVRAGGLVYYGGLVLATVLSMGYIVRKRLSARRMLDIVAPSLMLGLAFGRAGCTLNGCCWGGYCTLDHATGQVQGHEIREEAGLLGLTFPFASPAFSQQAERLAWKVVDADGQVTGYYTARTFRGVGGREFYRHVAAPAGEPPPGPYLTVPRELLIERAGQLVGDRGEAITCYEYLPREELKTARQKELASRFRSLPVYPVQVFGIANGLLLCGVLTVFFRRRRREGQVFALMLLLYPVSRFILEGIRKDTDPVALGLTMSQNISLYMFAGGALLWLLLWRLPAVAPVPSSGGGASAGTAT